MNNGSGTFTDATSSHMPVDSDSTQAVALGDVDGDGDLDMVIANGAGQQDRLYLNNGTGAFSDATATRMPMDNDNATSVALGDVDDDGDLDVVIGNGFVFNGQLNRLYLNDGTGTFSDATATQMPAVGANNTRSVALGDVDGDGDLDLICGRGDIQGSSVEQNRLYLNNGTGMFSDATGTRMPVAGSDTWSVALGDLDDDGDLDMVIGNGGQNQLYANLQRQLHAPTAPQLGQPYSLDAYMRYGPPSTVDLAAIYLSTGPASTPLPPYGMLGIDLATAAPFPLLTIAQPAGVGSVSVVVPNVAGLIGQSLYSQALLVAFPNDLRLSNVVVDVIQ